MMEKAGLKVRKEQMEDVGGEEGASEGVRS